MRVVVDKNSCQDHGQCVFAAPGVFRLDDQGHLEHLTDADEAVREEVEDAADVCPMQAIRIED
ncbi:MULTISPECIES: ferredoxin [Streptomyces]|uniref:Ferredoxin n=2 Tax=Streptomyces TaxID=1883 RepID=A0A0W7X1N3_9ACTN|nr:MULTISPECIES: ferredoxin [Streptomyces]KUF16773.1 ferredoxin [Streptomyces silvensis]MVO88765.1 ferredoxin [Streptomyces typhae]